mmetsp:Transcript_43292/g.113764  ORF Transcript_43292/g.113764 Transcript_43292/m.113764 type:complete len:221 (+) Transcript_43292:86-748(+)
MQLVPMIVQTLVLATCVLLLRPTAFRCMSCLRTRKKTAARDDFPVRRRRRVEVAPWSFICRAEPSRSEPVSNQSRQSAGDGRNLQNSELKPMPRTTVADATKMPTPKRVATSRAAGTPAITANVRPRKKPQAAEKKQFRRNSSRLALANVSSRGGIARIPLPSGFQRKLMMQPHWLMRPMFHIMTPAAAARSGQEYTGAEKYGAALAATPRRVIPIALRT